MTDASVNNPVSRRTLATDLDGTLIPLEANSQNKADLRTLGSQLDAHDVELVYVTGRHLELIEDAVQTHALPIANWIISDVGTTLYERVASEPSSTRLQIVDAYFEELGGEAAAVRIDEVRRQFSKHAKLSLQEAAKQNRLKASFYTDAREVDDLADKIRSELLLAEINFEVIASVDPFTNDGLIDIVPHRASKQFALEWWRNYQHRSIDSILFAGDSGNDWHAFTAGYRTVVVANTDRSLARRVYDWHREQGWKNRLLLAKHPATSGVLEACDWFEWFPSETRESPSPLGVVPRSVNRCDVRIWAPKLTTLDISIEGHDQRPDVVASLKRDDQGFHSGELRLSPGQTYSLRTPHGQRPDPTSRWQPAGVHGPSMVVDANHFPWQDEHWQGVPTNQLVIYELHVGTFTSQGNYRGVEDRLDYFIELGVNAIELMPVAQAPGNWNWGYDGVQLFAPRNTYGTPDELRSLIDACHRKGLSVFLDVVYNHLGPEGNYLAEFGPYFSSKHHTPWGESFGFDSVNATPIREFIVENALYWLRDFHFDGIRFDAVHFMLDDSSPHILEELRSRISQEAATWNRHIHLIAETNVLDEKLLSSESAEELKWSVWCDDLMHAAHSMVASQETFPHRHYDGASDFAEALRAGYLYSGTHPEQYERIPSHQQLSAMRSAGSPHAILPLVIGLQNHDKVGNHPLGYRIHQLSSLDAQSALAALFLMYPAIPQIFMGEEVASETPFYFFADFEDDRLRRAVDRGRKREYPHAQWKNAMLPSHAEAFYQSILHRESEKPTQHANAAQATLSWYQRLLQLRQEWQSRKILDFQTLTVKDDSQQQRFALIYESPHREPHFVVAQFPHENKGSHAADRLHIKGRILLDSRGETHPTDFADTPIIWGDQPRAVVGIGQMQWATPSARSQDGD